MKHALKKLYRNIPLKKELFSFIKSFGTPPPSVYKYFIFWDKFKVKVKDKHFWLNHYGLYIENEIFWGGLTGSNFEKLSMQLWIELCTSASCVMDIGANTGIYALVTKTLNPQAKVYAFEPIPRTYNKLVENVKANNFDVTCESIALSDEDGQFSIFDPDTEHNNLATLNPDVASKNNLSRQIPVVTRKLSTYIREHHIKKIDLIKIDVEGHEPNVLEGMEEYLDLMKPTLLIEINSDEMGAQIESLLKGKGYLYFNIDEKSRIDLVPHLVKSYHNNYLICSRQVAECLKIA